MKKSLVFWLGRSLSPWDHRTALETGIGGSEVAALRLTSALAARGYDVTVYADIRSPDSVTCNPRWLPFTDDSFPEKMLSCDLLVSSRCPSLGPGARDRWKSGKLKPTWLWMHDLHVGADWDNAIGQYFDRVICLTPFAKERFCQYYPRVESNKVCIIPNGIYPDYFNPADGTLPGDQHRRLGSVCEAPIFIWSSCPDRGLDRVLAMWRRIREEFPGSRLYVYGDFYGWVKRIGLYGTGDQQLFAQNLSQLLTHMRDDPGTKIRLFGKVGQRDLAACFRQAHVWFYPTSFEETSCITALEAQAAGTKIVCTAVGALPDTAPRATFLPPWNATKEWENTAIGALRKTLAEPVDSLLSSMALLPSWDHVAKLWEAII